MIAGIFHEGSGLGNQLFRYVTTRTLAEDKGYQWGMIGTPNFKGEFFKDLYELIPSINMLTPTWNRFEEKKVLENGIDIRSYDPEINFVQENTIIDGEFQDDKYWRHKLPEIDTWLSVEPIHIPDNVCVIGFRGGEYYSDTNLGLTHEYYLESIEKIKEINPDILFEVHTDDPEMARSFFPYFKIIDNTRVSHSKHSNMGLNWRSMRYAKYAIIANSSFYILPRLLKHQDDKDSITIAPRYWARRNTKTWALPSNYYREFQYV